MGSYPAPATHPAGEKEGAAQRIACESAPLRVMWETEVRPATPGSHASTHTQDHQDRRPRVRPRVPASGLVVLDVAPLPTATPIPGQLR